MKPFGKWPSAAAILILASATAPFAQVPPYAYRIPLAGVDAAPAPTGNPGGGTDPGSGTNPPGSGGHGGSGETPTQPLALSVGLPAETMNGIGLNIAASAQGGTGSLTIVAETLPPGLSFNGAVVSGTPDAGNHAYAFKVTDSATPPVTATASGSIRSYAPLTASVTGGSPNAEVKKDRSYGPFQIASSGGKGDHTYGLASGSLPQGVTLSPTGLLSGNPTQIGSFSFRLRASEEFSPSTPWVSDEYTLNVTPVELQACVRTVGTTLALSAAQVTAALDGAASLEINYVIVGGGVGGDGYNNGYVYQGAAGGDTTISLNGQQVDVARRGGAGTGFTSGQVKTGYLSLGPSQSLAMQVGGGGMGGNSISSGGSSGGAGSGGGGAGGNNGGAGGTNGANGQAGVGSGYFPGGMAGGFGTLSYGTPTSLTPHANAGKAGIANSFYSSAISRTYQLGSGGSAGQIIYSYSHTNCDI